MSKRFIWLGGGLILFVPVVGLIALSLWVGAFLRSEAFRGLVGERTSAALHAKAKYEPLRWSGSSVFSPGLSATGNAGSTIQSLEASQIRADVDWRRIFSGAWSIEHMDVVHASVVLRAEPTSAPLEMTTPEAQADKASRDRTAGFGFLPSRFELAELSIQNADIQIGDVAKIENISVTLQPEGTGWIVSGRGGQLSLQSDQGAEIETIRIRLQRDAVHLTEAGLRFGDSGRLVVSGELGIASRSNQLRVDVSGVDLHDLIDGVWTRQISGSVSGRVDISSQPDFPTVYRGNFLMTDGHLADVPFFATIADFTRSPQFRRMPLHEVSGDFEAKEGGTEITGIIVESRGLLRIEGTLTLFPDDRIRGIFQIGVTPQTLQWLPGSQEKVFLINRDGYLWTPLEVGGTLAAPTEDLSVRLAAAMGETVIESGVEVLQNLPDGTKDAVGEIIDTLIPLFR